MNIKYIEELFLYDRYYDIANITEERIEEIVQYIEKSGVQAHVSRGTDRTVIGIIGKAEPTLAEHLRQMKGVENVIKISKSYKLASRDFHPDDTVIEIKGVKIGGEQSSYYGWTMRGGNARADR